MAFCKIEVISYITKLRYVVNAIKYSSQFILQEKSSY